MAKALVQWGVPRSEVTLRTACAMDGPRHREDVPEANAPEPFSTAAAGGDQRAHLRLVRD